MPDPKTILASRDQLGWFTRAPAGRFTLPQAR